MLHFHFKILILIMLLKSLTLLLNFSCKLKLFYTSITMTLPVILLWFVFMRIKLHHILSFMDTFHATTFQVRPHKNPSI